jgi:hypothetical protein
MAQELAPVEAGARIKVVAPERTSTLLLSSMVSVVAVELPFVALLVHIVADRPRVFLWGDQAVIDLEAARASGGHELLGPYSRYGWHHLGPIWLVVLGWVRAAAGGTTLGTVYGALLVHAVGACLVVLVARRLAGPVGGMATAGLLVLWYRSFGLERLAYIWNPWAIAIPALLLFLLCARMATMRTPPTLTYLGAVICGSFLVQTHVSTGLLVVALLSAAPVIRFASKWRWPPDAVTADGAKASGRKAKLMLVGLLALCAMWAPPAIDQISHSPGNVSMLIRYARTSHQDRGNGLVLRALGTEVRSFPFGKDIPRRGQDADPGIFDRRDINAQLAVVGFTMLVGALAIVAYRRRHAVAFGLAIFELVVIGVEVASIKLAVGPLFPYLVSWMSILVLPAWLAAVVLLLDFVADGSPPSDRGRRNQTRQLTAVAVALTAVVGTVSYDSGRDGYLVSNLAFVGGTQSWNAAQSTVDRRAGRILITLSSVDVAPIAAAIADQAIRRGHSFAVNAPYLFIFGNQARSNGREVVEFLILGPQDGPSPVGARLLDTIGPDRLLTRGLRT